VNLSIPPPDYVTLLGATNGMTPFFRSINYESRLAASIGWQEDYNYDEQKKKTALPGANSLNRPGFYGDPRVVFSANAFA